MIDVGLPERKYGLGTYPVWVKYVDLQPHNTHISDLLM